MILGYKAPAGGQESYHFGKTDGVDRKFIRVIAGAALPIFDRMLGAVVIIGEVYRAGGPATWVALDAAVGDWPQVENAMAQYRRDLKYTHVIVEREEVRRVIWYMKGANYGINEIPLVSYAAPFYSSGEVGRGHVDELIKEGRFILPTHVQSQLELEPAIGCLAQQCALCWAKENSAYYAPLRQQRGPVARILGMEGL